MDIGYKKRGFGDTSGVITCTFNILDFNKAKPLFIHDLYIMIIKSCQISLRHCHEKQ